MQPEPFHVNISDDALEDLRNRLRATRWPDELHGVGLGLRLHCGLHEGVGRLLAQRLRLARPRSA